MNLQQEQFIQAVIYNTTQDKWYIFFSAIPNLVDRVLVPNAPGNSYQQITTDEQEAEAWLHKFYDFNPDFLEVDETNATTKPDAWAGQTFFGVVPHSER